APYVFYFFLPIAWYVLKTGNVRRIVRYLPVFVLPAAPFLAWRWHVVAMNSRHPDWSFIPGYYDFVDMGFWYYGPLAMRFVGANWATLGGRFAVEVLGYTGAVFFPIGLWLLRRHENFAFVMLWIVGVLVAILVFFNLNVVHNYYQNPLLAIGAI